MDSARELDRAVRGLGRLRSLPIRNEDDVKARFQVVYAVFVALVKGDGVAAAARKMKAALVAFREDCDAAGVWAPCVDSAKDLVELCEEAIDNASEPN